MRRGGRDCQWGDGEETEVGGRETTGIVRHWHDSASIEAESGPADVMTGLPEVPIGESVAGSLLQVSFEDGGSFPAFKGYVGHQTPRFKLGGVRIRARVVAR